MNFFKKSLAALSICLSTNAIADSEIINVVTEPSFAPFEFMDQNTTQLIGFDIDIINAIAEVEGLKLSIASMPFDGQIPAVLSGNADIAISGFTITKERAKLVNFSEPYYDAGLGAIISKEHADSIKTLADLEGKPLCTQIGTSGAMFAEKIKDANVTNFNTAAESFMELNNGSCVAVINDKPILEYYLATSKNKKLFLLPEIFTYEQYGIVTAKKNKSLTEKVAHGLKVIKENGTYDKLYEKWFK